MLFGGKLLNATELKKMTTLFKQDYACGLMILKGPGGHPMITHGVLPAPSRWRALIPIGTNSISKLALPVLTVHSGGKGLWQGSNELTRAINACVADASAYYVMSFEAPPSGHVDEYHALTAKVDKPKIKTRTTTAYYGLP